MSSEAWKQVGIILGTVLGFIITLAIFLYQTLKDRKEHPDKLLESVNKRLNISEEHRERLDRDMEQLKKENEATDDRVGSLQTEINTLKEEREAANEHIEEMRTELRERLDWIKEIRKRHENERKTRN